MQETIRQAFVIVSAAFAENPEPECVLGTLAAGLSVVAVEHGWTDAQVADLVAEALRAIRNVSPSSRTEFLAAAIDMASDAREEGGERDARLDAELEAVLK